MLRFALFVLLLSSTASADVLDAKAFVKKVQACAAPDALAALGAIEKAETVGKRPASTIVQLVGKKARGYVVFESDGCFVVPVIGKPRAFARGNFGHGATVAYALRAAGCAEVCATVVSLKTKDDKLLDVLPLSQDCADSVQMTKRPVFAGRDSIELACWASGGADQSRTDYVLDAGDGALEEILEVAAGVAWEQINDNGPRCTARPPGGIKVVTVGAKPAVDVTTMATPEDAEAAKVEWHSGGCEATIATRRHELAGGKKLVPTAAKAKISVAKKLCRCKRS